MALFVQLVVEAAPQSWWLLKVVLSVSATY
jgi:hypothetical protein